MNTVNNKVYITGYGVVSALGIGKKENTEKLFSGMTGLQKQTIKYKDQEVSATFGAVADRLPIDHTIGFGNERLDRVSQLAIVAADEALEQAQLLQTCYDALRIGVVIGTSLGGMVSGDTFHSTWLNEGIEATDQELLKEYPLHAVADVIAKRYGFKGAKLIISTACSSGANAVGVAADLIRDEQCDAVIAGGVDPLARFSFAGFTALGAINKDYCQPYGTKNGINIGEGSAFFILESEQFATQRNIDTICEFCGYGLSADAYHPTAPDTSGNGAIRSMRAALANSQLQLQDISYINGHGTGTDANDNAERKMWQNFVQSENNIPMISNKGAVGHCMGAAGAVELAFSVMSLEKDMVPPTLTQLPNPGNDTHIIYNAPLKKTVNAVLSNSFAFGGNNCSVILAKRDYPCTVKTQQKEEVVITGIGCVGVGGSDIASFFTTLREGKNVISKLNVDNEDFISPYAGIADVDDRFFKKFIQGNKLRRLDKITKFTMTSGRQAILDAHLVINPNNAARIGVIYATGTGPATTIHTISEQIIKEGIAAVSADTFPNSVLNAAPGNFSISNNLQGVTSTFSTGLTSGLHALMHAHILLKTNQADAIIVVASDEWHNSVQVGYERLGILSHNGHLPLSQAADGMIHSEGSVAFVLERKSYAVARGANIYAKIKNYFSVSNNPALSSFDYEGDQWEKGMTYMLKRADQPTLDFYVATSYGDNRLDHQEFSFIDKIAPDAMFYSLPRLIGTPGGAVGSYAALTALYVLLHDKIPPMPGAHEMQTKYYNKLANQKPKGKIKYAATSVASFGGSYAGMLFSTNI